MSVSNVAATVAAPAFRLLPGLGRRMLRALLGIALTLTAMAGIAVLLLEPPEFAVQQSERAQAPRPEWIDIVRPFQLYALPSPAFGAEPQTFTARRRQSDGDRIDALAYGAAAPGPGNWLQIEIRRIGGTAENPIGFFPEMARMAARSGYAVDRMALPRSHDTRFGAVEIADLQLVDGDKHNACLGFRLPWQEPGIGFAGIACGTALRPLDRPTLACALDRLDLVSSGEDRALAEYFARTESRRGRDCPQSRPPPMGKSPEWLANSPSAIPLKGTLAQADRKRR
jgi:hypothetical protein